MHLTSAQQVILEKRYLNKDESGKPTETPEEMFHRVADFVAETKEDTELFYGEMITFRFVPSSPVLMNAGNSKPKTLNLNACYVLPIEDSLVSGKNSIMDTISTAAAIFKEGGGVGYNFGALRPKNAPVGKGVITGFSSGPVIFMKLYNELVDVVKAGGGRRGAQMAVMPVNHPDIIEFIDAKCETGELTNFNVSVGITADFMNAVLNKEDYLLSHPAYNKTKYISADALMEKIAENAWRSGEPGVLFLDNMNKNNPVPLLGNILCTNPCGEVGLLPNEACCLGSINLSQLVKGKKVDWDKFEELVRLGVRFLDSVLDKSGYHTKEIREAVQRTRKVGLGVMGFAEALVQLQLKYDSEEALEFASQVAEFMRYVAISESSALSAVKGRFPAFKDSIFDIKSDNYRKITGKGKVGDRVLDYEALNGMVAKHGVRNANFLSIAPTGTIAMIAGTSYGIEPFHRLSSEKRVLDGERIIIEEPTFVAALKKRKIYSPEYMVKIGRSKSGSCQEDDIPQDVKDVFVTAHDITPEWHIRMQAAWQQYVDLSISKTVNMPSNTTPRDIKDAYILAHRLGCKGLTVYVHGSREDVIAARKRQTTEPRLREDITLTGKTGKYRTCDGSTYVTVNTDEFGEPFEVFINGAVQDGCATRNILSRIVSLLLQCGIRVETVIDVLTKERCPRCVASEDSNCVSLGHAVSQALVSFGYDNIGVPMGTKKIFCPNCESESIVPSVGGCDTCPVCGMSSCSTI